MLKTEILKKPRRSVLSTVLVIVLGASIVICGIALAFAIQKYRLLTVSKAIHRGREQIVSLKEKEENVLTIEDRIGELKRQCASLDSIRRSSVPTTTVVGEIERAKPRTANLEFIDIRSDRLELIGTVPLNRIAVDYVRQLKNSSLLSETELVELKTVGGLSGLAFKIVARWGNQP